MSYGTGSLLTKLVDIDVVVLVRNSSHTLYFDKGLVICPNNGHFT
jgi:hypothetical protein